MAMIDEDATVKRYFREGDRIRLQPENSALEPIYADEHADFAILGKVTALFRRI